MKARPKLRRLSVEYNLTEHCNLSCYLCDHASPLLPERFASPGDFMKDLEALSTVLHTKQLRIVGGEPLLHPRLTDFLREARRIAIADQTVVITNGTRLHAVPDEFWGLIDQLWLSVYPGVRRKFDVEACREKCRRHGILFKASINDTFNETLLNAPLNDRRLTKAVFSACAFAHEYSCHTVHEGRFHLCCVTPFVEPRLKRAGRAAPGRGSDTVALRDNPRLYEEIKACLERTQPLEACAWCLGSSGRPMPHRQLNEAGRAAWLAEDQTEGVAYARRRLLGRA